MEKGWQGNPPGDEVDAPVEGAVEVADLGVDRDAGPVAREDGAAEAVGLDERGGAEARRLGGEIEAPDSREEAEVGEGWGLGVNGGGLGMESPRACARSALRRHSRPPAARRARASRAFDALGLYARRWRSPAGARKDMDNNEPDRERPDIDHDEHNAEAEEESLALGTFILAIGDCAGLLSRIRERVDDHLRIAPNEVTWGHVADADRLLHHLRQAAFVARIGEEPLL